ncbi:MAG: HlyC/CorC family transporter [Pseudomonadales bacterium]|nr:HlyC/CorC family transporter [Pseudomonadales bacterium]
MSSLVIIIVLLVLNGFFVAAEFSLVKVRGFRVERLASDGSASARLTMRILGNLEAYLAACQLGITMASLGLGWVGEPAVAALLEPMFHSMGMPEAVLHTVSFLIGFLLFSSLHIVVGEQVPKSYAIRQADTVALWCAYPLHVAYLVVYPLNWLLDRASRGILSIFGVPEATHADIYTGEELQELVSTSKDHGSLEHGKAEMLANIFEFDQRSVGRVMVPRHQVNVLDLAASVKDNQRTVAESGHSRFPLVDSSEDEKILGVVLVKSIYAAMLANGNDDAWQQLQSHKREPLIVPERQRIAQLFEQMRTDRNHIAIVVDEYGKFTGIVTLEDLLEEIVGEIEDETDSGKLGEAIKSLGESEWQVDGLVSLGDLQRLIGLQVEAELEANTLSGLLMDRLERMPEVGDTLQEGLFEITVGSMTGTHVGAVRILKHGNEADANSAEEDIDQPAEPR